MVALVLIGITALRQAQQEIAEQRFMSVMCKRTSSFQVEQVLGTGQNGMVSRVRCIEAGHSWPDKRYAMKMCFNFDKDTLQAQGAYVNEFRELVRLPSHSNIVRFLCEFFHEIDDSIRGVLPEFARDQSMVRSQGGSVRNRKTQFFVIEQVSMSLQQLMIERYAPPSIVPDRLVRMVMSQVASGLVHLEKHLVAHRDIKLDNILVDVVEHDHQEAPPPQQQSGGASTRARGEHQQRGEGEVAIKRCVIADFGCACSLTRDLKSTMVIGAGGNVISPMWGNAAHIAPELHSALGSAIISQQSAQRVERLEVTMDYSRQAVFELGVVGFEIVTGDGPIGEYPSSVADRLTGMVRFEDDEIGQIAAERLGAEQSSMLRRMVSCDASRRPSLMEVIECFDRDREFVDPLVALDD